MKEQKNMVLRKAREFRTHQEMADFLGIRRSNYTKLENGATPSLALALHIAKRLNSTVEELFIGCVVPRGNNGNVQTGTSEDQQAV